MLHEQLSLVRVTIESMQRDAQTPATILRRIAELESELQSTRDDLKNVTTRNPAVAEIVMRGARLSRERSNLEQRLELLRRTSQPEAFSRSTSKDRT